MENLFSGTEFMLRDELGRSASDQHSFGGAWTRIKLEALEKYLAAFNTALSNQSFTRIYIDGFAGTGRCDIKEQGAIKVIDGSARRALLVTPAFHRFCFIELHPKKLAALKSLQAEHPTKNIEVIHNDANAALKALCRQHQWRRERAVLFLDPFGMHVEWSTLEAIAKTGAIDVWYLFPYAGLYRQAAKKANALDADKEASLTRVLGTEDWRHAFYGENRQPDLFGGSDGDVRDTSHRQMLEFVSRRLKGLFPAVTEPKVLYQGGDSMNPSGAPLFALYLAVSNPAPGACGLATKIAKHILKTL